jgi:hypothetical protein
VAENPWDQPGVSDGAGLLRLVYVSHATQPPCPATLRAIEASAARRNSAAGITGLLISQDPYFYGLMEGPQGPLLDVMEAIITDPRHHGLRILSEEQAQSRRFREWRLFHLPGWERTAPERPPAPAFIFELSRRLRSS